MSKNRQGTVDTHVLPCVAKSCLGKIVMSRCFVSHCFISFTPLSCNALTLVVLILVGFQALMLPAQDSSSRSTEPASPTDSVTTENLLLSDFSPRSTLEVAKTDLPHAKFPVIDVHNHFFFRYRGQRERLDEYVRVMDQNNIAISVSLDAVLGNETDHLKYLGDEYRDRLVPFAHIDFIGDGKKDNPKTWASSQPGFVRTCVEQLKVAKENGILGIKFFKAFGLTNKNADGSLMKIDDTRWDPIWETCGTLKLPIIIHVADPVAFFQPIDANNERLEELGRHPDWSFHGDRFPSREELLAARNRVIKRHSKTTFIGAHVANNGEDLASVGKWLDEYPNLVIEFASRINELGRQPYSARDFFIKYQDRVLFGTDGPWEDARLKLYWRFLETRDEYFPYSDKQPPPQGYWRIYGIHLPDDVLEKVYFRNALRILPRLQPAYQRATAK